MFLIYFFFKLNIRVTHIHNHKFSKYINFFFKLNMFNFVCLQNVNQMSSLEWSTRIKGFIACFVIGIFFSLMGATALVLPLPRRMAVFGIFYTLGNITSLLR